MRNLKQANVLLLLNCSLEGSDEPTQLVLSGEAGYTLTAEEIIDDGICCTVGIYEPV